ncbi:hypothetical protein FOL47_005621 [Perkinsus chesapeaki]|uniref:Uncharacterized protein n=1 Tax=Perkinsus chesapeaki TaxID=330153 RepID=A0A7J6MZN4_PERCH|nr:hypothetical protein FOL47_005621 [Perkinsus chesapeaki]
MEARRAHGAAYRQQQLLYSQVSDGAEYFFIPRGKQPIPHMEEWQDNGLSTGSLVQLDNKARNVEFTKSKNIAVYDYIPYNEKVTTHTDEAVTAATILRVKDGQTSEYTATVPTVGECFSNIESVSSSSDEGGSVEAVASELSKVCGDGFWTLRPFDKDDMSKLNGKYSGKQSETALTLKLDKGKIKDGELVVGSLTEKAPLIALFDEKLSNMSQWDDGKLPAKFGSCF